jgi:glycosyltransferase involved in cell wall biosynthesis
MVPSPSQKAPQKIAFDARFINDQYHGIGRHAFNLLEALSRLDSGRQYLVFYHPGYRNSRFDLADLGRRPNVELRPLRLDLYSPAEQFVWPWLLLRHRAAALHSPWVSKPLVAPTKTVVTVHDLIFERFRQYRPRGWLPLLYRWQTRVAVKSSSAVMTVSRTTKADLQNHYGIPDAKIHVIGAGVSREFHRITDPQRLDAVRERYGLPAHFVLTLGVARPHKNIEVVVDALSRVSPEIVPTLVIAGGRDPRFPDSIDERVRGLGLTDRVKRVGPVDESDLPALYTLADALIFPSLIEGFGLPVVESMACGTPVVAANAQGTSEAAGDAAVAFNPRDAQMLAEAVCRVLTIESVRADLIDRGRRRAASLGWDAVGVATMEVYRSILKDPRSESSALCV